MIGVTASDVLSMKPELRQTPYGWLAISREDAPLPIGVVGATAGEAEQRFAEAQQRWAKLRDQPDAE